MDSAQRQLARLSVLDSTTPVPGLSTADLVVLMDLC
jgi:hypothetical protein